MARRNVLVIGLDSATLDLVRPWAAEGILPNLASLLEEGAVGPLRSTLPPLSPAAWSTFATGVGPGQHGILDFQQFEPTSYDVRFVNASDRRGLPFWEAAGAQGVRGGVLNVPVTYPPRGYNGFIVSGMLTPRRSPAMASPSSVFRDLMEASPEYAIDVDLADRGARGAARRFVERSTAVLRARRDAALGLYRKHRPPLFCVVFTTADRISHYFWRHYEAVEAGRARNEEEELLGRSLQAAYRELDEAVGALTHEAGPETDVLVLSDHGAGPLRRGLNLYAVLEGAELLVRRERGMIARLVKDALTAFAWRSPRRLQRAIKTFLPGLTRRAAGMVASGGIDWQRTLAYPTGYCSGVFVNLRGRQPAGAVPDADYEDVRDRIVEVLAGLIDPETGGPVFARVARREEVWSGPRARRFPDVFAEPAEAIYDLGILRADKHPGQVFYPLFDVPHVE
ncbi:MAG: alkaline phosphatase family protein, partial [Candidatus Brocadiaceae bacterium]